MTLLEVLLLLIYVACVLCVAQAIAFGMAEDEDRDRHGR
jgi:hypothetical protein